MSTASWRASSWSAERIADLERSWISQTTSAASVAPSSKATIGATSEPVITTAPRGDENNARQRPVDQALAPFYSPAAGTSTATGATTASATGFGATA